MFPLVLHDKKSIRDILIKNKISFLFSSYFDSELVRLLYSSLIRPLNLEFAVPVWNLHLKRDSEEIEKIQRTVTRLLPSKPNELRGNIKVLKITSLETRRKRGDLIQYYKVQHDIDHIEWKSKLIKTIQGEENGPVASNLRKKGISFHGESAKTSFQRENFFSNMVIPEWNKLPLKVKEAPTLNSFKARLDKEQAFMI